MFVFGILSFAMSHCYDFNKMIWSFQENVITFGGQLFAYFYQIWNKCYCLIYLLDLFTSTIISSASQKYKVRRSVEGAL